MSDKSNHNVMTNREFVALIRAKLAAAGHADIVIDRAWIDEDTPGYPFFLNVPVGTEHFVPLMPLDGIFDKTSDEAERHMDYFAQALINLHRAEKMLVKYAKDVRRAANLEVAAARAKGLDVLLENVGFKPTNAYHLSGSSWKEAALHILASVEIRHLSFYLRPEVSSVWVEEAADVADELKILLEEQTEHQQRAGQLEAVGADLEVDQITLDILAAHGFDVADILRSAWKKQCVNLQIKHEDRELTLSLLTCGGKVKASIELENAYWNGEYLWFTTEDLARGHEALRGRSLGDLIPHPAFTWRPIVQVVPGGEQGRDEVHFDLSDTLLFDADTGRIWRQHKLAA